MAYLEVKNKKNYKIFKYDFDSLDDFLNELITKRINSRIFSDPHSIKENYEFTKTKSFEQAWNLCKFTFDDGYKRFSDLVRHVEFKYESKERIINTYKPVGTSASVPRFLYGIPDNMRAKKLVYDKPIINLYFQYSYSYSMTENQIKNRGILTLALINYLENVKNYNVNFNFVSVTKEYNEIIYVKIILKNINEKLKLKKCYFPLVHPSFVRRLHFRLTEIIPFLKRDWSMSYGHPLEYEEIKDYIEDGKNLENAIYISTPDELGIYGRSIEEDSKNFIDKINSKYKFLNEDEDIKRYSKRYHR